MQSQWFLNQQKNCTQEYNQKLVIKLMEPVSNNYRKNGTRERKKKKKLIKYVTNFPWMVLRILFEILGEGRKLVSSESTSWYSMYTSLAHCGHRLSLSISFCVLYVLFCWWGASEAIFFILFYQCNYFRCISTIQ